MKNAGDVQDLLVTDRYLIKGRLRAKNQRLSRVLENCGHPFLLVEEAVLVDLVDRTRLETPQVLVNLDQLVLAHEFLDLAGDEFWQGSTSPSDLIRVRAHTTGPVRLELTGLTRAATLESTLDQRRYVVLQECEVTGPAVAEGGELEILSRLPYVIVRRGALSCIYAVAPR